jgi:hypothetical protein
MSDGWEDQIQAARRRFRWLNAYVLLALGWATVDLAAMALALDGNRALALCLEVAAALIMMRAGYVLCSPRFAAVRRQITLKRSRL